MHFFVQERVVLSFGALLQAKNHAGDLELACANC